MFELHTSLGIPEGRGVTAIVGGGWKTSLMFSLAVELAEKGKIAVATTTTKIFPPERNDIIILREKDDFESAVEPGKVYCLGEMCTDGKLHFPGTRAFETACRCADRVFVEADGAKHMPVKAPNEHEPVIPKCADSVVAVAGLDAIGGRIRDVCFRIEKVCAVLNSCPDSILTPEMLARLLVSTRGQRKAVPSHAVFSVVLNKADNEERMEKARQTAGFIREAIPECRVAVTALTESKSVRALYE